MRTAVEPPKKEMYINL